MQAPALSSARLRRTVLLLGPAFVAAVAYVDPGNVGTNVAAGARFGYLLLWVIVVANVTAVLVQYLAAKVTIATGKTLPELCQATYSRPVRVGLMVQSEAVAIATDLAEVIGGAIALQLLFDMPLVLGGVVTGAVSLVILGVQSRGQVRYEHAILLLLGIVLVGFLWSAIASGPSLSGLASGLVPRLEGVDSLVLATGILGATVMPHAIWLHGALVRDRHGDVSADPVGRRRILAATRVDVGLAMVLAGTVNAAMLIAAAAALQGSGAETIQDAYAGFGAVLGSVAALLFALALLASALASSSVGTYAGAVILEGFGGRRIPLLVRRMIALVPALGILAVGVDTTEALVISQVVLSFGIPFALWPLVALTGNRALMGDLVNRGRTTLLAGVVAAAISVLNVTLIVLLVA
ncbi:MAG: Nramp family divalent metal transporter [Candidatus Nanopelagicales bacterium]